MNVQDWAWLIATLLCVVLELVTYGIFFVLFAVGTLVAFIVAQFSSNIVAQVLTFAVVTILCLIFLRPAVRRWLKLGKYGADSSVPDYIEQYQGKIAVVLADIPAGAKGQVKIDNETWTAKAVDGRAITAGSNVRVLRIEGVTAVVESQRDTSAAFGLKQSSSSGGKKL